MFTHDIKEIVVVPFVCIILKESCELSWLWHQRLSHLNLKNLNNLVLHDLVRGLHVLKFDNDLLCVACELEKNIVRVILLSSTPTSSSR